MLYMSTRLIVNLSQTYITMYLTNSLLLPKVGVEVTRVGVLCQWSRAHLSVLISCRNILPASLS